MAITANQALAALPCNCANYECKESVPLTNPIEYIYVNLTNTNPNRIGREKISLNCL